ncbi:MAG: helix-turn-helix transcriptional regulator [Nitrospirae bacterium]|nr:helix-turn-helix transcriptional regulator [Nitrospirota bacterium]
MNPHDIDVLIGINLKRIRTEKGLSQEKLGKLINNAKTKISALENGKEGLGKELMAKLCTALQVKPAEFYLESDTPIINNSDELKIIKTLREQPESKEVLIKISEAYELGDKKNSTGETKHGSNTAVKGETKKRLKSA